MNESDPFEKLEKVSDQEASSLATIVCPHCQKEIDLRISKRSPSPPIARSHMKEEKSSRMNLAQKQPLEAFTGNVPNLKDTEPIAKIPDVESGQARLRILIAKKMSDSQFQVPPIPGIAERVLQMADDASSIDLAKLISSDQAITSSLMRIANSAYYGGVYQFETLPTAITRIGIDQVRILILGFSMLSKEFAGGAYQEELRSLNEHAVACAYLAAHLADLTGVKERQDAFLGGLLHDIGKLIIYATISQEGPGREHLEWSKEDLNIVLSEYHGSAGAFVAAAWKLQPWLEEVIRHHHTFQQATERPRLVALVALANRYCHRFGLGCSEEEIDVLADGLGEPTHFTKGDEPRLIARLGQIKDLLNQISHLGD